MQPDQHASQPDMADSAQRPPAPRSAVHARDPGSPEHHYLSVADLAERARGLIRSDRRVLLGITGAPGAGKSSVAEAVRQALGDLATVVGMDGFHLAQSELVRLGRQERKGAPDTFDSFGYAALLSRLRDDADPVVYAPVFRRDLEEPIGSCLRIDRATPLVITEGNYLLLEDEGWQQVSRQLDHVWFLDLPDEIRLRRLTLRHQAFGKDPDAARRWATGSDQANAAIVRGSQDRADLIIRITS